MPITRKISATPLPVSMALAGHTNDRELTNVHVTSITAHVRMATRICTTDTRNPRTVWPRMWIEMMTAARCKRGSRIDGSTSGYRFLPRRTVRGDTAVTIGRASGEG